VVNLKRIFLVVLVLLILTGCEHDDEWSNVLQILERLLKASGCSFSAHITADYGQIIHTFSMHCEVDRNGTLAFTVVQPDTIAGITGTVSSEGGKLTFDDHVLAFELMAEGRLSPVSAPWIMIHALRGGYMKSYSRTDEGLRIEVNDSYQEDALQLMIDQDRDGKLVGGEIYWKGQRLLTVVTENFDYL
jgi:hypothetical protein